jgi:hypothetical protein
MTGVYASFILDGSPKTDGVCHGLTARVGTYVHFACALNQKASDGSPTDRNGLFTRYLLKHVTSENKDLFMMFMNVNRDVFQASERKQTPTGWNGLMLDQHIYLNEIPLGMLSQSFCYV